MSDRDPMQEALEREVEAAECMAPGPDRDERLKRAKQMLSDHNNGSIADGRISIDEVDWTKN